MNAAQVKTMRQQINAAHAAGDAAKADKLQAELHEHFAAEADKFMGSQAGREWMGSLMKRP